MARLGRYAPGGLVFHVVNRGVARLDLFTATQHYEAFESVLREARERVAMRILAFCLMPNHWHLVLWPGQDGDLSRFMRCATTTHAKRWHAYHGTEGTGALYQSRFKGIPVQSDRHLHVVCRYVERNPVRAGLVARAESWHWSSLSHRAGGNPAPMLDAWPVPRGPDWSDYVNVDTPREAGEPTRLRDCVRRGSPFGGDSWRKETARSLGLASCLRSRGWPSRRARLLFS